MQPSSSSRAIAQALQWHDCFDVNEAIVGVVAFGAIWAPNHCSFVAASRERGALRAAPDRIWIAVCAGELLTSSIRKDTSALAIRGRWHASNSHSVFSGLHRHPILFAE